MWVKSAPRAIGAMAPERAGPERASRGGVSRARFQANSEGPCRGMSPAQGGIAREGAMAPVARGADFTPNPALKQNAQEILAPNARLLCL